MYRTEDILQAARRIVARLPELLGDKDKAAAVESELRGLFDSADSGEDVGNAILRLLAKYDRARQFMAAALKPPEMPFAISATRFAGMLAGTVVSDQPEAGQRRYLNVCFVRAGQDPPVPKTSALEPASAYELRLDIGAFSPDSAVENVTEFPASLLPQSKFGHWLEVVLASEDFSIPSPQHAFFLPRNGPSWVCACKPGGTHSCTEASRQPYLRIPVTTPAKGSRSSLRIAVYYSKNLIQSQLLSAEVAGAVATHKGYGSRIDYTLCGHLDDVSFLPPRSLNIVTNQNQDGSHRIIINSDREHAVSLSLNESRARAAILEARNQLWHIHMQAGGENQKPLNLLDRNNAKSREAFLADLRNLAPLGWALWCTLTESLPAEARQLQAAVREPGAVQISRTSGSTFVFPWALVYDIPLQQPSTFKLCKVLDARPKGSILPDGAGSRCPFQHEHGLSTICPYGFWGFRHVIEQPPSMPPERNLPIQIRVGNSPPQLVAALSLELDQETTQAHLAKIEAKLGKFKVLRETSFAQLDEALKPAKLECLYFYCHGKRETSSTGNEKPFLVIGTGDRIAPTDITAWRDGSWSAEHWAETSPLVFINGCHTVELTPELLVNFVDAFTGAYASGVIGTEIQISQGFASEAAEEVLSGLNLSSIGKALQQMRLHFLQKGNLLGLAYTAYCSAELALSPAAN